jgi:hypothetical protein
VAPRNGVEWVDGRFGMWPSRITHRLSGVLNVTLMIIYKIMNAQILSDSYLQILNY